MDRLWRSWRAGRGRNSPAKGVLSERGAGTHLGMEAVCVFWRVKAQLSCHQVGGLRRGLRAQQVCITEQDEVRRGGSREMRRQEGETNEGRGVAKPAGANARLSTLSTGRMLSSLGQPYSRAAGAGKARRTAERTWGPSKSSLRLISDRRNRVALTAVAASRRTTATLLMAPPN